MRNEIRTDTPTHRPEITTAPQIQQLTVNTSGLHPHPARTANAMPHIPGVCPACGCRSLFAAVGGYITCAIIECPNPTAVADLLLLTDGPFAEALSAFAHGRPYPQEPSARRQGNEGS